MKKTTTLMLMSAIFPLLAALGFEYKNSNEAPIPEDSPTQALVDFLKAGTDKNTEAVLALSEGSRRYVLKNKPNAMEEFFARTKDLDFNSSILWAQRFEEDYAVVDVEIQMVGKEEKFQTAHRLKKIDGVWKVVI